LADVDNGRHIGCRFFARPSIGLHEELILEIIDTESAEMRTGEVKDLTSGGRSFACKKVHLVIAVEMVLVVSAPQRDAFEKLLCNVRVSCCSSERR
jgi:hypothetical protein